MENKDYPVIVLDKKYQDIKKEDLKDLTLKAEKDSEEVEVNIEDIATVTEAQGVSSIKGFARALYIRYCWY